MSLQVASVGQGSIERNDFPNVGLEGDAVGGGNIDPHAVLPSDRLVFDLVPVEKSRLINLVLEHNDSHLQHSYLEGRPKRTGMSALLCGGASHGELNNYPKSLSRPSASSRGPLASPMPAVRCLILVSSELLGGFGGGLVGPALGTSTSRPPRARSSPRAAPWLASCRRKPRNQWRRGYGPFAGLGAVGVQERHFLAAIAALSPGS